MFRVFALDPETVARSWESFRNTAGRFGVDRGRLIADFPPQQGGQRWEQVVHRQARANGLGEVEQKRITAKLIQLRRSTIPVINRFNRQRSWLENVAESHVRNAWQAVLTDNADLALDVVLRPEEIDEAEGLFCVPHDEIIARTGDAICGILKPLLHGSRRVELVDPYFLNGGPGRWIEIVSEIIATARQGPTPLSVALLHTRVARGDDGAVRHETRAFEQLVARAFETRLPQNAVLEVLRWDDLDHADPMHPRYVLTDLGGVGIDWGLDTRQGGRTDLSRLTEASWKLRLASFDRRGGDYQLYDSVTVRGRSRYG